MEPLGFYNTKAWAAFRTEALKRARYCCEAEPAHDLDGHPVRCREVRRLHVHHEHGVPLSEQVGLVFCAAHHAEMERWLREDSVAA